MQTGPSNIGSRAIADVYTRPTGQAKPKRGSFSLNKVALTVVLIYLLVPLAATLVFGVATGNGIDFSAIKSTFTDPDLSTTLIFSLETGARDHAACCCADNANSLLGANALAKGATFAGFPLPHPIRDAGHCVISRAYRGIQRHE